VAEHAVAHAADDAIEPARAEGQALEPQGHPVEGGAESRAEGERRRRRRGRRGGRRNRRDREGGDAALMPNNQPYPHEQQEPEHDAPQTFAPPADLAPAPRAPEPSSPQAFESRAAEPAPPEPGPAPMTEPRRRSTVREPAPHFGEPSQPAPTPVRPPEPMSPPQAEQEDANRPRRTGWWSRR
jgi:ribonuclease E